MFALCRVMRPNRSSGVSQPLCHPLRICMHGFGSDGLICSDFLAHDCMLLQRIKVSACIQGGRSYSPLPVSCRVCLLPGWPARRVVWDGLLAYACMHDDPRYIFHLVISVILLSYHQRMFHHSVAGRGDACMGAYNKRMCVLVGVLLYTPLLSLHSCINGRGIMYVRAHHILCRCTVRCACNFLSGPAPTGA